MASKSAIEKIKKDTKKFINARKIEEAFRICKKLGITTLGHFIIGLPGEDEKSILKTIEFSKRIGCDYAAFNLYVPRMGTVMRKHFIENKKIEADDLGILDCSLEAFSTTLPKDRLIELHRKALKEFYMRPSHILRLLSRIRTWRQFINLVGNGLNVIKRAT